MSSDNEADHSPKTLSNSTEIKKMPTFLVAIWSAVALVVVAIVVIVIVNHFGDETPPATQANANSNTTVQTPGVNEDDAAQAEVDPTDSAAQTNPKNSSTAPTVEEPSDAVSLEAATVGDTVRLGEFSFVAYAAGKDKQQQDDFEWIVLAVEGDRVLLISKDVIDIRPYNTVHDTVTWENCSLRQWLNNDFYDSLPADVRERIVETPLASIDNTEFGIPGGNDTVDRIFVLSLDEADTYFASDEQREAVLEISGSVDNKRVWRWWLRTPGNSSSSAAMVGRPNHMDDRGGTERDSDGSLFGEGANVNRSNGVRPVFWLER